MADKFRVAHYEGVGVGSPVDVGRAPLDDHSDVYYMRSTSGCVDKADPSLVVSRRSETIDALVGAIQKRDPEVWANVVQPDITIEVIREENEERSLRVALLTRAALLHSLMFPAGPDNHWIRTPESESVGVIDKREDVGNFYADLEMGDAKIIRQMGANGLAIAAGFEGDAWILLANAGKMMVKANVNENRSTLGDPVEIAKTNARPHAERLRERLAQIPESEREDYKHLTLE